MVAALCVLACAACRGFLASCSCVNDVVACPRAPVCCAVCFVSPCLLLLPLPSSPPCECCVVVLRPRSREPSAVVGANSCHGPSPRHNTTVQVTHVEGRHPPASPPATRRPRPRVQPEPPRHRLAACRQPPTHSWTSATTPTRRLPWCPRPRRSPRRRSATWRACRGPAAEPRCRRPGVARSLAGLTGCTDCRGRPRQASWSARTCALAWRPSPPDPTATAAAPTSTGM